jgi:PAS domain S-box-containing protein
VSDASKEVARLEERLRLVSEILRGFAEATTDLDRLLGEIVKRTAESLHDACSLWLLSDDGNTLELAARHHVRPEGHVAPGVGGALTLDTQPIMREALETGRALLLSLVDPESVRARTTTLAFEAIERLGIHSMLVAPLRAQGRSVGVMFLTRDDPTLGPFDEHDRVLAQNLGDHAALTIVNARAFEAERTAREGLAEADRVFFALSPVAMYVLDPELMRGAEVNQAALALYGYTREEFLALPLGRLRADLDPTGLAERTRAIAETREDAAGQARHQRRDGALLDIEYLARPTVFRGRAAVLVVLMDVTDRQRVEEQRRRIDSLDAENQRAQEASRLKSEFLANMSHELRTPLNAVMGFAALMHDGKVGPVSDTQKEYLGDILTSSRNLLHLIDDVLDLSKIESGRLETKAAPVDVAAMIRQVEETLSGVAAEKRLAVSTYVDPAVEHVVTDDRALTQVLDNYLSNAIKFTPNEGKVSVRVVPDGPAFFVLEVADTGIGVKPEDLAKLFVEFQQLDSGLTKHYAGAGLGLALTKRIVESLGGTVSVESTPGQGSRFSARLPRSAAG